MECYPPCGKQCSGICKADRSTVASKDKKPTRKRKTVPAQSTRLPGYIILICGRATTPEDQRIIFGSVGRQFPRSLTRRTKFWCERHSRWERPYTFSERLRDEETQLPYLG